MSKRLKKKKTNTRQARNSKKGGRRAESCIRVIYLSRGITAADLMLNRAKHVCCWLSLVRDMAGEHRSHDFKNDHLKSVVRCQS